MKDNNLFQNILDNSNCNKLVFFVGAGVSAVSNYPSWKQLIDEFHKRLYGNTKDSYTNEEYLQLPQIYYDNFNEEEYINEVLEIFNKDYHSNIVHDLMMMINPRHILTTNYDNLLEEVTTKFGKNYSVINSDLKVSSAVSNNYILKVHGDFETNNFVLKEEDYLNYSENFKLIDILMKTVMASNLVVFIGYSLGDYNIKLILNWVKQVQGDTFINPIFIYTGMKKVDTSSIKYYKNRGIRIIDANEHTDSDEYKDKYMAVLEKIIKYKKESHLHTVKEKLELLYNKLKKIESIPYIRYKDFQSIFNNDYYVDDRGYINRISKEIDYIQAYFDIDEESITDSNSKNLIVSINNIFSKYEINGYELNNLKIKSVKLIDDDVLENNYTKIENYVLQDYYSISENYPAFPKLL